MVSFFASFLDSSLGTGYGTVITPLLILTNFPVVIIVPAVLLAQIVASLITSLSYHLLGNVEFTRTSIDTKIALTLSIAGIIGATIAITIFYTLITITPLLLQLYVGIALLLVGSLLLIQFQWRFTWTRIFTVGTLAAINKGLIGGGYTPIITGCQLLTGRTNKQAIGSTEVAKAITSLTAVLLYTILGHLIFDPLFIGLTIPLFLSTLAAAPLASYLVKRAPSHRMTLLIGSTIIILGIFTLLKTIFSGSP